ncbi:MAG TPA: hypothetical protein VJY54_06900 [Lachnospiraceae bacterium]|nr:hypothetical protein [Lachnospiraceae bacterium]
MESTDTIHLLKECDAGSKMAVSAIDEVLEKVTCEDMKQLLSKSKEHHEKLGNEFHAMLNENKEEEKDPSPIAKSMAYMKTGIKMTMDNSDATVADLITDGCNMGVKSLNKYKNQYKNADQKSISLCDSLISIEENLCKDLREYL